MKKNKVFGVLLGSSLLLGSFGEVRSMMHPTTVACFTGFGCGSYLGYISAVACKFCIPARCWSRCTELCAADQPRQLNIAPPAAGEILPPPGFVAPQLAEAPMAADEAPLPDVQDVQTN
ncbi:MAG: hypothetical protein LBJ71_00980 [Holosporaceae bacterium]|jgi:hypothetical protein|nr:hypothetical protein [Holosporaceae bacterium]